MEAQGRKLCLKKIAGAYYNVETGELIFIN
jgi:hypothetical protein